VLEQTRATSRRALLLLLSLLGDERRKNCVLKIWPSLKREDIKEEGPPSVLQ